jgi:hypothetical protein
MGGVFEVLMMAVILPSKMELIEMSTNVPVATLVFLGTLVAVLGLFAAGNIVIVIVGLVAVFLAGVLQVAGSRVRS